MTKFSPGQTVVSRFTGRRVIVTGQGREPGGFAGRETGKPDRFCLIWDNWQESSFEVEP